MVRWENPQGKFRVGIQPNTTSQWQYLTVNDQDSIVFPRDRCEQYFKISVAAFCDAKNDFAAENFIAAGDSMHVEAYVYTGLSDTSTMCPGTPDNLYAGSAYFPRNNNYHYEWFRNDSLIAGSDTILLSTNQTGDYSFNIIYQGCSYASNHEKVVYTKPRPFLTASVNGLDVTFSNNHVLQQSI
ncbi:MAG: hypothetical protein WDM78_12415 [Puia sp.]